MWELFAQRKAFADPKYYSMNTYGKSQRKFKQMLFLISLNFWLILSEKAKFITSGKKLDLPEGVINKVGDLILKCWERDVEVKMKFSYFQESSHFYRNCKYFGSFVRKRFR